jgi:adenylyltransferase/sulfurtransferase
MNQQAPLSNAEIARYSRHLILEQVGLAGQEQLKASSVLCVGTGGLGAPLLMYLAAAGVGRLGLVDFDVVEESNLQRQVIHGTASVGKPKVASAVARIKDINPHIQVDVYEVAFTAVNALQIAANYDVIVDGTDNFPTRYLVNDVCEILGKPNVYGSVFKFEGQASVFNYQGGPTYRDLYPEPPPPGMVPNCAEGGVLGVLPGLIGLIQATETIKVLLGLGKTLSGRLLLYDAIDMRFRELRLPRRSATPVTELVDYEAFCGFPGENGQAAHQEVVGEYGRLTVREAKARLDAGWQPYVLDVRKPYEAEIVQLDFTDRLHPHETIQNIIAELPTDRDILVYCRTGVRSATVCQTLTAVGLSRTFNLEGGVVGWAQAIAPELPVY